MVSSLSSHRFALPVAEGTPGRYDNSSEIDGNFWSRDPDDAFFSGPNDVIGDYELPIPATPLPRGTTYADLFKEDPEENCTAEFTLEMVVSVKTMADGEILPTVESIKAMRKDT